MVLFILIRLHLLFFFFFFNDTATTEIYTLSLHDALPISRTATARSKRFPSTRGRTARRLLDREFCWCRSAQARPATFSIKRSEEHTSELQSRPHLVCRLLLEKKEKEQNVTHRISR